jgi:hypothetical protein
VVERDSPVTCTGALGRRGRNRTRGRHVNSVLSVPTHKPYDTGRAPRLKSAHSSHTRETATRFTARRHAAFRFSEITRRTCALGSGSQIRTSVLRVRAARPAVRRSRSTLERGFEPLPHGVRNRHASATLRAYESGGIRTRAAWGKSPACRQQHLRPLNSESDSINI